MEYVKGQMLGAWLSDKPRPWRDVLSKYLDAASGLAAVHAANLVHRDFKPGNVLVAGDGRVRVTDFGLARSQEAPRSDRAGQPATPSCAHPLGELTASNTLHGTPAYMAPESLEGVATERSDQFSFALSLYETLYGESAFESVDGKLVYDRVHPPSKGRDVPARLRAVVLRALSVDPLSRFPSMTALIDALRQDPPRAWWRRAAIALPLVGAVAVGGTWTAVARNRVAVCRAGDRRLVGAWDTHRKSAVHQALMATKSPLADEAWTFAERALGLRRTLGGRIPRCLRGHTRAR